METQQQLINKLYEKQQRLEKSSIDAPEDDRFIQEFIHGDGI